MTALSLHLLEPYRSAITSMGMDERLVNAYPPDGDFSANPSFVIGQNPDLRATALQLLVLFEDATLIYHELSDPKDIFLRTRVPSLSLKPMEVEGLLRFVRGEFGEEESRLTAKLNEAKTAAGKYALVRDSIETWKPLIVSQMMARGKLPDPTYLDVVDALLTTPSNIGKVIAGVPEPHRDGAKRLVNDSHQLYLTFIVIFSTLQELLQTDTILAKQASHHVAMAPLAVGPAPTRAMASQTARTTNQLFRIVLEALFEEGLAFVQPASLREVRNLRLHPDVRAFRQTFLPWLGRLESGDEAEERRLRAEVKAAARAFRSYPSIKRISKWLSYLSLPLEVVPGLGLAVHGLALGGEHLAEHLHKKSRWLMLAASSESEG
jgi:hypothetical protein